MIDKNKKSGLSAMQKYCGLMVFTETSSGIFLIISNHYRLINSLSVNSILSNQKINYLNLTELVFTFFEKKNLSFCEMFHFKILYQYLPTTYVLLCLIKVPQKLLLIRVEYLCAASILHFQIVNLVNNQYLSQYYT